ncbi:MAG: Lrp/AsnC family transcriptional regulator [Candidatus Micrarchaeia archaeon]
MIDNIDKIIINKLAEDSTTSINNIAKTCRVSRGTIRLRIKKLIEAGIIAGYNANIRYQNIGMTESILGLDIAPESYIAVLDSLKKLEFVKHLYRTSGDHAAIAIIVSDSNMIDKNIEILKNIKGIKNIYPAFIQEILK